MFIRRVLRGFLNGEFVRVDRRKVAQGNYLVYGGNALISANQHRYVTLGEDEALVFAIKHPVKPSPSDWSGWQKADYVLKDGMGKFALMQGREPKSKRPDVSADEPELRFKVVKE